MIGKVLEVSNGIVEKSRKWVVIIAPKPQGNIMSQEISLLILIETKEGQRKKQIDAFNKLAPLVLKETGCLQYELKEVENNENEFVIIEKWDSKENLLAHEITPHMIEADKNSPTFRAKPATVIVLKNITK